MANKYHIYLLELMILALFLTDTSEVKDVHMIVSDGENVTLSCNLTLSDCTSTSWIYYKRHSNAVRLFVENLIDHGRLSLGPNCSLNIYNVTKEDVGRYICRPQMGINQFPDANVYLHFLQVSPQSEIEPGSSVTLSCQVYSYDNYFCKSLFIIEGFQMIWVNESDVNLQSDSRYQISSSTEHCNSSLTTTLLNEDNNRELRCQIIKGTEVKTSARYTVKYSGNSPNIKNVIGSIIRVIIIIVEFAVLTAPTVILLLIICERRSGKRRAQSTRLNYVNCSESVVLSDC
ncbi:uncharacterized protein [Misgurnus anguillicaudatus]|uniref:uncharacterized protein isoform X2 n=1 Tax=Misgurnus anguillicaudatus TaxID=75329 RepID=UPI003CCFB09A